MGLKMECLISVIVPVYNVERYLDECVQSVLRQTYTDLEILLIDDGSTDASGAICDRYASQHGNVRVVHNRNQGPAASRKCGIGMARGELVMFVDADDWISGNMLTLMEAELCNSGADIVFCTYEDVYKNGKIVGQCPLPQEDVTGWSSFARSVYEIHGTRSLATGPWAKLYRKKLFENIDFREHITIGEDYTMLLQVLKNASSVRVLTATLYHRRMFGGNISRSGYTDRHRQALDNYLQVRDGLIQAFPQYRVEILGYHIEYEMAVITAMCRNGNYDRPVIRKLSRDLRRNMREILVKCRIPLYMKLCAVMIAYTPWIFIILFRLLHRMAGR